MPKDGDIIKRKVTDADDLSELDKESLKILAGTVRKNLGPHPVSNAIGSAAATGKFSDYKEASSRFEMLPKSAKKLVASDAEEKAKEHVEAKRTETAIVPPAKAKTVITGKIGTTAPSQPGLKQAQVNTSWDFQKLPDDPAMRRKLKKAMMKKAAAEKSPQAQKPKADDDWDPLDQGNSWDWKAIPGHKSGKKKGPGIL